MNTPRPMLDPAALRARLGALPLDRAPLRRAGLLAVLLVVLVVAGKALGPDRSAATAPASRQELRAATENGSATRDRSPSNWTAGRMLALLLLAGGAGGAFLLHRRSAPAAPTSAALDVIETHTLGPGQTLQLVACGDDVLLLSATSDAIRLLRTWPRDRFDRRAVSFADVLASAGDTIDAGLADEDEMVEMDPAEVGPLRIGPATDLVLPAASPPEDRGKRSTPPPGQLIGVGSGLDTPQASSPRTRGSRVTTGRSRPGPDGPRGAPGLPTEAGPVMALATLGSRVRGNDGGGESAGSGGSSQIPAPVSPGQGELEEVDQPGCHARPSIAPVPSPPAAGSAACPGSESHPASGTCSLRGGGLPPYQAASGSLRLAPPAPSQDSPRCERLDAPTPRLLEEGPNSEWAHSRAQDPQALAADAPAPLAEAPAPLAEAPAELARRSPVAGRPLLGASPAALAVPVLRQFQPADA